MANFLKGAADKAVSLFEIKKAVIKILDGSNKGKTCTVSFNPNELHFSQSAEYGGGKSPGDEGYSVQFAKMQIKECSFKLFFDTYMDTKLNVADAYRNVKDLTDKFTALIDIDKVKGSPPMIRFIWGSFELTGYVKSVSESYTMFSNQGIPVRAELDIGMILTDEKTYIYFDGAAQKSGLNGRPSIGK